MNTEIACIHLGNVHMVPVTCTEISLQFLRKQDASFASRPFTMAIDVLSKGHLTTIFSPLGDQRRKMKRVMVREMLSQEKHRWLHEKRVEEVDNLMHYILSQWENGDDDGLVDLRLEEEYVDAIFACVILLYSFCIFNYLPFLRYLDLEGHEKIVEDATSVLEKYNNPIIDYRIQEWIDGKKH
ncbi:hypothetical protein Godav_025750 [Gossypium davidsonii]|uniref:Cytochrome P450 n=1 Tax=Gossypium davidsonii TaxID=34287 RepID=A0A7J8T785_GOSDV|nr:hypothetical protein [Gossypium davidsonii]